MIFCLAVFLFAFGQVDYRLLSHFPGDYSWTELLINYQGGFVRRGLLGELAFRLNSFIPAPYFLIAVVASVYVAVTFWMVVAVLNRVEVSIALLFLFCPATILFPVYDTDAFGRKDIFILAAFALAMSLIRRARSDLFRGLRHRWSYSRSVLVLSAAVACRILDCTRDLNSAPLGLMACWLITGRCGVRRYGSDKSCAARQNDVA